VARDRLALQALRAWLARVALRVRQDRPEGLDLQDLQVLLERRGLPDSPALLDQPGRLDPEESPARRALREKPDRKDRKAPEGRKGRWVPSGPQARPALAVASA